MATYGSNSLTLSVGGTAMAGHLRDVGQLQIEATLAESMTFGDTWMENVYVGIRRAEPIEVSGHYDDTASSGPDAKFGGSALGTTVQIIITWGGSKTSTFNAIITRYVRTPNLGGITEYSATLTPTGSVTEA